MFQDVFDAIGLPRNEGKIYETLLGEGPSSAGHVAEKAGLHRRNVYDSLNRLIEKGLVFQIIESRENTYQAVEPAKLMELVREKEEKLSKALPELEELYGKKPSEEAVYMYRGLEGWKNYLRDQLQVGGTQYIIGATGAISDERMGPFFEQFKREMKRKGIKYKVLYRHKVLESPHLIGHLGENSEYKILPEKYSKLASVSSYGNRAAIVSVSKVVGKVSNESTITMIVNQDVADTIRTWFEFMWDTLPAYKAKK